MALDFGLLNNMIRPSFCVKMLSGLTDIEAVVSDFPLLQILMKIGPISDARFFEDLFS